MRLYLVGAMCAGASALRLPAAPHLLKPRAMASFSALAIPASAALAADDLWVELNKPPIEFNPLTINPVGYVFIAAYASYVAFKIFRPPNEEEKAWEDKAQKAAAVASGAAPGFLKAAAEAEGADVKPSGLVYREIEIGAGASPTADDSVLVHYVGTLHDGVTFDSSRERGEPATFKVGEVIKGWQEGLQCMKVGGKAVMTVPAKLAYGPMSMGPIPGSSALQFEVELLEILPPEEKKMFGLF